MSDVVLALAHAIEARNPLQRDFLAESLRQLEPEERALLEGYVAYCAGRGHDLEFLADCYDVIVKDTLAQQVHFMRHRRYRHRTYADVAAAVYQNDDYMRKYMHGLALTALLWPNHARMFRFFLRTLPTSRTGAYLEIGPGHGFYFMEAMRRSAYTSFLGVDISPTSVAMTRDILGSGFFGRFPNHRIDESDFLAWDAPDAFDAVVMGEVLEHVEDPGAFLRKIARIARPEAHIYVTTCVDSPAVDHIFLFESVEQVEELCRSAGLDIVERLAVPYQGLTLEETAARRLPINVAFVLARRDG